MNDRRLRVGVGLGDPGSSHLALQEDVLVPSDHEPDRREVARQAFVLVEVLVSQRHDRPRPARAEALQRPIDGGAAFPEVAIIVGDVIAGLSVGRQPEDSDRDAGDFLDDRIVDVREARRERRAVRRLHASVPDV